MLRICCKQLLDSIHIPLLAQDSEFEPYEDYLQTFFSFLKDYLQTFALLNTHGSDNSACELKLSTHSKLLSCANGFKVGDGSFFMET
jgi:hypothetical protein